jgi:hypothetical protein
MDRQAAKSGIDATRVVREDDPAYLAGSTISRLATLATIVVIWMFAI